MTNDSDGFSFCGNLAQLAADNNWDAVSSTISPGLRCVVRDAQTERLALAVASRVNVVEPVSAVPGTFAAVHFLLWSSSTAKDDDVRLSELLSVGTDPNLASGGAAGWRPVHYCAAKGWIKCLRKLCDAGLNLDAASARPGETALVVAERNKQADAMEILKQYKTSGCKPFCQLAEEKIWDAVLNRLRRQCVLFGDFVRRHKGKTALEWARFHGNVHVADEIEYWLSKFLPNPHRTSPICESSHECHDQLVRDLKRLVEKQQEVLNDVVKRLLKVEARLRAVSANPSACDLAEVHGRGGVGVFGIASTPSGEAVVALDDKITSVGALMAERDAELTAKLVGLQAQVDALTSGLLKRV